MAADPAHHPCFTTRLEPLTMLSALAAATSHVGLGTTSSTTYNESFTAARAHPKHAERYAVAEEFVDVVNGCGLWRDICFIPQSAMADSPPRPD